MSEWKEFLQTWPKEGSAIWVSNSKYVELIRGFSSPGNATHWKLAEVPAPPVIKSEARQYAEAEAQKIGVSPIGVVCARDIVDLIEAAYIAGANSK